MHEPPDGPSKSQPPEIKAGDLLPETAATQFEQPPGARGPDPHFSVATTASAAGVLIALGLLSIFGGQALRGDPKNLRHPAELAALVFERGLEMDAGLRSENGLARLAREFREWGQPEPRTAAIDGYREILARTPPLAPTLRSAVRGRLAVVLAETNRWPEAAIELDSLAAEPRAGAFVAAVRDAYDVSALAPAIADSLPLSLLYPPTQAAWRGEWSANRLAARTATRHGDLARAASLDARLQDLARRHIRWFLLGISPWIICVCIAPLVLFVWWRRRVPLLPRVSAAALPPPWFAVDGFAVLIWGGLLSSLFGIATETTWLPHGLEWVLYLGTFLPFLWLMPRFLLEPFGTRLVDALGLRVPRGKRAALAGACVVAVAVDVVVVFFVTAGLSSHAHWWEGTFEGSVWGSRLSAVMAVIGIGVTTPLIEELTARALFYGTLRRLLPAWAAVLVSGACFGAIHPYGGVGMLAAALDGAWWAFLYERTRSLWPSIAAHAGLNVVGTIVVIALSR